MARDNCNKSARGADDPQEQEEMTVVILRFKGSGHSLQKGFDAVSQAAAALGPSQPQTVQRVYTQRPPAQIQPAAPEVLDAEMHDGNGNGAGQFEEAGQDSPEMLAAPRQKKPPAAP